jgi:uncharacterized protein YceH (UPF0502 family)
MSDVIVSSAGTETPRWRPISARERRVLGVLVEKAKTTPDAYPMTLNAICTGCNQKNNRYPLTNYEPDDVEEALEKLRTVGAATEVQGMGRTAKYRHHFYEWLGVEKVEAAVMCELLLRGAQTEGDLRARAARMEPIPDLNALRSVLQSLKQKGLVIPLTPEGRGHVISHALYEPHELEKVQAQFAGGAIGGHPGVEDNESAGPTTGGGRASLADDVAALRAEVAQLREELHALKAQLG